MNHRHRHAIRCYQLVLVAALCIPGFVSAVPPIIIEHEPHHPGWSHHVSGSGLSASGKCLEATVHDGYVHLAWSETDATPEFQGYRLLRREATAECDEWMCLAQFDLVDGEGCDSGLALEFIDSLVTNGATYDYSLTVLTVLHPPMMPLPVTEQSNVFDCVKTVTVIRTNPPKDDQIRIGLFTPFCSGDTTNFLQTFNWYAWDPMARPLRFLFAFDKTDKWYEVLGSDFELRFVTHSDDSNGIDSLLVPGWSCNSQPVIVGRYGRAHTFFLRAEANDGVLSPVASIDYVSTTFGPRAQIISPQPGLIHETGPTVSVAWQGLDPDPIVGDPFVGYSYRLVPVPLNELETAPAESLLFDPKSPGDPWSPFEIQTGVQLADLEAPAGFILGVLAIDAAGAIESRLEDGANVIRFKTTASPGGFQAEPLCDAGGPYTVAPGQPVTFDGSASSDPDGAIVCYRWNFGDGAWGEGPRPEHLYPHEFERHAKQYQVQLCVTDSQGLQSCCEGIVDISADVEPVCNPGGPYDGREGHPIQFDGTGSFDPDGTIRSYQWDFGDGTFGCGPRAQHAYENPGIHTVKLCVADQSFFPPPPCCETTASPTPVELASFELIRREGAVAVIWNTALEAHMMGFHVLRAQGDSDAFERLTSELIPSVGRAASYEFVDRSALSGMTYRYQLEALERGGGRQLFDLGAIAVEVTSAQGPVLMRCAPNPFVTKTTLAFSLTAAERVNLRIYAANGTLIRALIDEDLPAGPHAVEWDGHDDQGVTVSSGVYFCRLSASNRRLSQRILLIK